MLVLADLLASPYGRDFLNAQGLFTCQEEFLAQLQKPRSACLSSWLGQDDSKLVYSAQEIYVDYPRSVVVKLLALNSLLHKPDLFPFFLWLDTDRSGADLFSVRINWPLHGEAGNIRVSPQVCDEIETRFVSLRPPIVRRAIDRLGTYLSELPEPQRTGIKANYKLLRTLFLTDQVQTLSELNQRVTYFLLHQHLKVNPPMRVLSQLLQAGLLTDEITLFINHLDQVIPVFNESIDMLLYAGIHPQVKPLPENYFPLHFSCPLDHRRLRLRHERRGESHFAVAGCPCGAIYSFDLGTHELSLDALIETERWSPDVCLLIFLNDLVSGWIAGKSTALYSIVFRNVLHRVFGKIPVPVLIPPGLEIAQTSSRFDSLIYDYLISSSDVGRS